MKLTVNLGKDSYPIYIENNILSQAGDYIRKIYHGKRIMIISDDNVFPLYGDRLIHTLDSTYECHHLVLPHGESTKDFQTLPTVYKAMLEAKISRSDLVIALGGGVIGDLAGFAASSYLRGVRLVQIPTSLVLIDPLVLNTLKERFINDGMGEVIKYGCIKDADLFSTLESHSSFEDLKEELPAIITRCVDIKRMVVENDQFDTGERMLLNFGHTLAHTIEQHFHYRRESHGEAVAIGMYQITRIAEEKGLTPKGTAERIQKVLKTYGLPFECGLTLGTLTEAIALDKKNLNGNLNVILLHEIGDSYIEAADIQFFAETARLV